MERILNISKSKPRASEKGHRRLASAFSSAPIGSTCDLDLLPLQLDADMFALRKCKSDRWEIGSICDFSNTSVMSFLEALEMVHELKSSIKERIPDGWLWMVRWGIADVMADQAPRLARWSTVYLCTRIRCWKKSVQVVTSSACFTWLIPW